MFNLALLVFVFVQLLFLFFFVSFSDNPALKFVYSINNHYLFVFAKCSMEFFGNRTTYMSEMCFELIKMNGFLTWYSIVTLEISFSRKWIFDISFWQYFRESAQVLLLAFIIRGLEEIFGYSKDSNQKITKISTRSELFMNKKNPKSKSWLAKEEGSSYDLGRFLSFGKIYYAQYILNATLSKSYKKGMGLVASDHRMFTKIS
jgi:hypothetical protein